MTGNKVGLLALSAALLIAVLAMAACGDDDRGFTQQEVEDIVRSELAASTPGPAQPGLTLAEVEEAINEAIEDLEGSLATRSQVEEAVQAVADAIPEVGISKSEVDELLQTAIAGIPEADPGLTPEEVRLIAARVVATIPSKTSPARFTQYFVNSAIARYEVEGLDSTVAHYNDPGHIDGQWYVFIVHQEGEVVSHFNPTLLGENLDGPLGTDANGYNFGPEMLSTTGEGKWVSYVYNNPENRNDSANHLGTVELKHAWVVRHDDLIFGSGWYVNADEFTMQLVAEAIDRYRNAGLEDTIAQFAGSDSATAGLSETIAFYNSAEDITGDWFALIADRSGEIVAHYDPAFIGSNASEIYGREILEASSEGSWLTSERIGTSRGTESLRAWGVRHDGMTFAAGWKHQEEG